MNENREETPLWELKFKPTAEEYYEALCAGGVRKAGKTRLIVQSVILAVVAIWCVAPVFFGGTGDYTLAGVAVAVALCMWLVPPLKMKSDAKNAAAADITVRVKVFADGVQFGENEPFAFEALTGYVSADQLTLSIETDCIPLPFRAMSEECRLFLLETIKVAEDE